MCLAHSNNPMFGSSPSELEVASIAAAFEAEGNPVEIPQAAVPE